MHRVLFWHLFQQTYVTTTKPIYFFKVIIIAISSYIDYT